VVYLDSELIVEVLDLIVCLSEMLHRVRHQLLLLLLAGVRLLGQLKDKHHYMLMLVLVFRIRISVANRDVYPGSEFFPSRVPDPNFFPSRICIKEFKYFNPKKCFYALGNIGCSSGFGSRIRILIFNPCRILDPGVRIRNTDQDA
jgi:hypothetical protein